MSAIGISNQTAFLTSLGFSCEDKEVVPPREPGDTNIRDLALIISNLRASRPAQEPQASSQIASIEHAARKTRAALSLRYQLISTEISQGETYNPLRTIRNRRRNNFEAKGYWTISNDELLHDLAFRRGCERAPTHCEPERDSPYQSPLERRHRSQFLISRLQEKRTHAGPAEYFVAKHRTHSRSASALGGTPNTLGAPMTPKIIVSGAGSLSSGTGSGPENWSSGEEPEYITAEGMRSVGSARSRSGEDDTPGDITHSSNNRFLESASNELVYINSVLQAALRQHRPRTAPSSQPHCHIYTKTLQECYIPKHLDFLADSERSASTMYHEIEENIVNPTETLKLETDRMIADINTSLNLKLRNCATMMTELERCGHSDCLKRLGYRILELAVSIILRSIWVVVTVLRLLRWILVFCGILSPKKPKTIPCVCPTPLPSAPVSPQSTPQRQRSGPTSTR